MEMLTSCVQIAFFQLGFDIYQQEEGMAMGSQLSPVIANMEYLEEMVLGIVPLKTTA